MLEFVPTQISLCWKVIDFVQTRKIPCLRELEGWFRQIIATRPDVTVGEALQLRDKPGRPPKSEDNPSNGIINGGNNRAYTLARLDRDKPELAAAVREGRMSAWRRP